MTVARVATAIAALGLAVACARPAPEPPRHVLLVTLDTTRADRIGAYGMPSAGTPTIDGLAARGVRFDRAYAHVPITLPSHATMMTGLLPPRTGVRVNGDPPRDDVAEGALATALRAHGFATVAAIGGYPLSAEFGLAAGFDRFDDALVDPRNPAALERSAERVVDAALAALEATPAGEAAERRFVWLHFFDPHDPYEPPPEFAARFPQDPYQGEIAAVDAALGRFLDRARDRLPEDDTLVVVVGDHGEALGEHGEPTHGFFLYESTVRVPWVVAGPGIAPRVVFGPVGLVDLAPTVLASLGLAVDNGLDGRAIDLSARDEPTSRPIYLETELPRRSYGWSRLRGVVDGDWKWIEAPRPELYDVVRDPLETIDETPDHGDRAESLRATLDALVPATEPGAAPSTDDRVDPRLASLGYVGTSGSGSGGEDDPKDRLEVYVRFQRAARALEASPPDPVTALDELDRLLELDPTAATHAKRAVALRMLERYDDALDALDAAGGPGVEPIDAALERGRVLLLLGRVSAAGVALDRFLAEVSGHPEGHLLRGAARERDGDLARAERDYRVALEGNPAFLPASHRLAALLFRADRHGEAAEVLRGALRWHPDDPIARGLLGEIERGSG